VQLCKSASPLPPKAFTGLVLDFSKHITTADSDQLDKTKAAK